jgi:hypothetical protein
MQLEARHSVAESGERAVFTPLSSEEMATMAPDEMLARAEQLFGELPIEIQNPENRGSKVPIPWTNTEMDRAAANDLMRLSGDDLEKYQEVLALAEHSGTPMIDLRMKAHFTFYEGHFTRHHIPEQWRPARQSSIVAQKLASLVKQLIHSRS